MMHSFCPLGHSLFSHSQLLTHFSLVLLTLQTSSVGVDEFAQRVQEVTRYPLRSFVLPFLRLHVPVFQYELRQLAAKCGISVKCLLAKNPSPLFDFSNFILSYENCNIINNNNKQQQHQSSNQRTTSSTSSSSSKELIRNFYLEPFEIFLPPLPLPSSISLNTIVPSCKGGNSPTFQPVGSHEHQLPIVVPSSQAASLLTIPASVFSSQGTIANTRPASDLPRLGNFYHPSILSHLSLQSNNQENHFKSPRILPNSPYNLTTCTSSNMGIKDLPVKRRMSSPPDSRKENELHPPTPSKRMANIIPTNNSSGRTFPINGLNQSPCIPGSTSLNHLHHQSLQFLHSNIHALSKAQQQQSVSLSSSSSSSSSSTTTTTTSINCNDHHHRQGQSSFHNNNKQIPTGDKLLLPTNGLIQQQQQQQRKESNESDEEWQNIHTVSIEIRAKNNITFTICHN